ncbi:DUF4229 domain-containing protein [Nocardioides zeae]|uniref:DUF4229 domain-containing protein n=1 Tax=Nocardioides imazamoxiresistens TaxID=3231893 RepID=A0ABU3PZX8_9ACTN|nr:DUF4229 domain-containing protein [Nocardioides zeae]MDT9594818.1 DUF4229 domain-containing protein [Nocardioides zeae]
MKEFAVYTLMRLVLFVVTYGIVLGVYALITDIKAPIQFIPLVIAFLISGILSYLVLDRQREAFAQRIDDRAKRISEGYEKARSREDDED